MKKINWRKVVASAALTGALSAGAVGLGAGIAEAAPAPPPVPVAPAPAPPGAPPAPAPPSYAPNAQVVWNQGQNHWGIWLNGVFIAL